MTYEVLDTEAGDVVAVYGSRNAAETALRSFIERNPQVEGDMAIAVVNGNGLPDEVIPAADLGR